MKEDKFGFWLAILLMAIAGIGALVEAIWVSGIFVIVLLPVVRWIIEL